MKIKMRVTIFCVVHYMTFVYFLLKMDIFKMMKFPINNVLSEKKIFFLYLKIITNFVVKKHSITILKTRYMKLITFFTDWITVAETWRWSIIRMKENLNLWWVSAKENEVPSIPRKFMKGSRILNLEVIWGKTVL